MPPFKFQQQEPFRAEFPQSHPTATGGQGRKMPPPGAGDVLVAEAPRPKR